MNTFVPTLQVYDVFKARLKEITARYGVPLDIRRIEFDNGLDGKGVAHIQDVTVNGRIMQFMLDAGGNMWQDYECYGPPPELYISN